MQTTPDRNMKNILNKYVEIEARKRAQRIDTAFKQVMPEWQWKLMLKTKSRLLGKLLGYELRTYVDSNKFEIWRWGKKLYYTTY
jgi:hypothetical protein